jgi:hypothetical protein
MPVGKKLTVELSRRRWLVFREMVGRLEVLCISPAKSLLEQQTPTPLDSGDVNRILSEHSSGKGGVPTTLVLASTSGFTIEAHELAERSADRTLIMAEPNDAGGWMVSGPAETKAMVDLFDPEAEQAKRKRVRDAIQEAKVEMLSSGLATDGIAAKTQLPLGLIENELKSYAKENAGLVAKRLDGRVVLFRESAGANRSGSGGSDMPFIERVKTLFWGKGDNERKIAFLAERRTALSQQRDRAFEEISALDGKEAELKGEFKDAATVLGKRRITSQLLHSLELVEQGQSAKLPDSQEMAEDAAAAEEMLAQLQADTELAASTGVSTSAGMTAEEQSLYEELERETAATAPQAVAKTGEAPGPAEPAIQKEAAKPAAQTEQREAEPG